MPRVIAVLFCPKQIRDNCSTIRAVGDFINLPLHANKKKNMSNYSRNLIVS